MNHIFTTGETVRITCAGRTLVGEIVFASGNGRSLMLGFEAILEGHVGMMPVLRDDDSTYRSIMNGVAVMLEAHA